MFLIQKYFYDVTFHLWFLKWCSFSSKFLFISFSFWYLVYVSTLLNGGRQILRLLFPPSKPIKKKTYPINILSFIIDLLVIFINLSSIFMGFCLCVDYYIELALYFSFSWLIHGAFFFFNHDCRNPSFLFL